MRMKKILSLVAIVMMALTSSVAANAAESSEAYIEFDMSRVSGWQFPRNIPLGGKFTIPYVVYTYMGNLTNVKISLLINDKVVEEQEVDEIAFDEEMGEGSYIGSFSYTPRKEGDMTFQLKLDYDGAENNEGENETDVVTVNASSEMPAPAVLKDIATMKAYEPTGNEDVVLTLTDAKVTYTGTLEIFDWDTFSYIEGDVIVFEDASAGIMLQGSGLGQLVSAGQILNGEISLNMSSTWGEISATLTDGINGIEVTDGTVTPLELNDDNIFDYALNPDWRLVKFENVTITSEEDGDYANIPILSNRYGILNDALGATYTAPVEGKTYTATGYIFSMFWGMITIFQPISFEEDGTATAISSMTAASTDEAPVYNLNGLRVSNAKKGLYISNGKKVVVK